MKYIAWNILYRYIYIYIKINFRNWNLIKLKCRSDESLPQAKLLYSINFVTVITVAHTKLMESRTQYIVLNIYIYIKINRRNWNVTKLKYGSDASPPQAKKISAFLWWLDGSFYNPQTLFSLEVGGSALSYEGWVGRFTTPQTFFFSRGGRVVQRGGGVEPPQPPRQCEPWLIPLI